MFLIQDIETSEAYSAGYKIGKWIGQNPMLSVFIGIVISVVFVWIFTKIAKQIRTFDKD